MTAFTQKEKKGFLPLAPYNREHSLFYKNCEQCVEELKAPCILACDEVYNKENGGILRFCENCIVVDFGANGCLLCGECANACPNGVLDKKLAQEQNPNWNFFLKISEIHCLAYQKILCNTCKDVCYSILGRENAIVFNGLFYPEIKESCIGCAECVSKCPTQAILLFEKEKVEF
nr:4Fe-4S binding protein [Helicobacter turcicus]